LQSKIAGPVEKKEMTKSITTARLH